MKFLPAILSACALLPGLTVAEELSEVDKLSYGFGQTIGANMQRESQEVNVDMLVQGLRDKLSNAEKPLLSQEEVDKLMKDFQRKRIAEQMKKREALQQEQKQEGKKNLAAGEAFLAENAKKEGIVSLPSGLQYKVLRSGTGKSPQLEEIVTTHYRGTLIDGTEFDSSYSRGKPAKFRVNQVIAGWTQALQMMKEGGKWQLFIPPKLAYGEKAPGKIGSNSTLIFEVELIKVGEE